MQRKSKAPNRADTRGHAWAGIPHAVLDSEAYRHLTPWSRALLVEIVRRMNGYNNGKIVISQRELCARLMTSNFRQISKATVQLLDHGLIDISIEGEWTQRRAREYRLTFASTGAPDRVRPATNDYLKWSAK